jgi:hypothetical protein
MRISILILLSGFFILAFNSCTNSNAKNSTPVIVDEVAIESIINSDSLLIEATISEAKEFCKSNNLNQDWFCLLDYSKHSGLNRFFIVDLDSTNILDSALVSHGCGNMPWGEDYSKESVVFSNFSDSHCSSYGKYKIGKRGYSQWGINVNYKLHGLDSSNTRAYNRLIVLHSWDAVSDFETFPSGTPEGWGCPAVSNNFMRRLDSKLKLAKKETLMWILK